MPIHLGPIDMSINRAVVYLLLGSLLSILLGLGLMRWRLEGRGRHAADARRDDLRHRADPGRRDGPADARRWRAGSRTCATLLIFIFVVNLLGFIPLPFTGQTYHGVPVWGIYAATSSISVTLALALMTWIFQHIEGIRYNGAVKYFKSWIPEVPKALLILIVPIEILSQFMRLISLSVRLYANMLAGHILILTMIGLVFIIHTPPWRFFGLPGGVHLLHLRGRDRRHDPGVHLRRPVRHLHRHGHRAGALTTKENRECCSVFWPPPT